MARTYIIALITVTFASIIEEGRQGLVDQFGLVVVTVQVTALAIAELLLTRRHASAKALALALGAIGLLVFPSALAHYAAGRWLAFILDCAAFVFSTAVAYYSMAAFAVSIKRRLKKK